MMGPPPSQKELSELEQGKSSCQEFFDTTAKFLQIDLKNASQSSEFERRSKTVRKAFAPREEFVLKLLLKKVSSSSSQNQPSTQLDHVEFYTHFWRLLLYAVESIPVRSLAQILSERDFLQIVDNCTSIVLSQGDAHNPTAEPDTSDRRRNHPSQKKRKLSPAPPDNGPVLDKVNTFSDLGEVQTLILQVVQSLVQLTKPSTKVDCNSSFDLRTVLSASAEKAASITGKLLRINLRQHVGSEIISSIAADITLIWQYRRSDSDVADVQTSNRAFTKSTLRPALETLTLSNRFKNQEIVAEGLTKQLERLIALHSVLPLRTLFQAERASQWKSKTTTITWDDFKDLYEVLGSTLIGNEAHQTGSSGVLANFAMASVSAYLDIAIRAVPRSTLRRTQTEQPWIDCLFSVTAYLISPGLPRMNTNRDSILEPLPTIGTNDSLKSLDGVGDLLNLILRRDVVLSLPVLVYFASAVLAATEQALAWTIIAKLAKQNVDVFLPNSGLPNAKVLLQQVCQMVSNGGVASEERYSLVRDELIKPLLDGFAQARDLRGFVSVWLDGLEYSMQQRASGELDVNTLYYCLLWEDETLFSYFENVCKVHATPTFARELVEDLLNRLDQIGVRVGPTVDIISRIAVVDSLLKACSENTLPAPAALEEIITATMSALERRSDYQYQRWRLWAFLRQCLLMQPQKEQIGKQWNQLDNLGILMPLPSAQDVSARPYGSARSAYLQEALECFHLRVVQDDFGDEADSTKRRQLIIKELVNIFSINPESSDLQLTSRHLKQMQNEMELARACTGIILAHPRILHDTPSTAQLLLSTMIQFLSSATRPDLTTQQLLQTILAEECDSEMFDKSCATLSMSEDSDGNLPWYAHNLLSSLPLECLQKSIAEGLAERLVIDLQKESLSRKPADALANLVLLERLATTSNVSIGKPQNWRRLTELANAILSQPIPNENLWAMIWPLQNIFHQVWQRILQSENTVSTKSMVQDIYTWCVSKIDHLATSEYTAGDFTVLRSLVDGMSVHLPGSPLALPLKQFEQLSRSHSKMLVCQFQRLAGLDMANERNMLSFLLVTRAMKSCSDLPLLDLSESILITIDGVEKRWKSSFPRSDLPLQLSAAIENVRYQLRDVAAAGHQHVLTDDDIKTKLKNFDLSNTAEQQASKVIKFVESVGPENFSRLLDLIEECPLDSTSFLIIGAIVSQTTSETIAHRPRLAVHMRRLATLRFALQAQTVSSVCVALESCIFILDALPEIVNQWTIDSLLGTVASFASPESLARLSAGNPAAIFQKLCSVLGLALTRYRKRLGGRYHLLLPALQALLRCLFYSGTGRNSQLQTKQQIIFARSFPFWLASSKDPLPTSSAEQFTRILTTICDPSASSARSTRHRGPSLELTDETKKARSLAGHYMQYLVMEYAKCTLNGRIKPEVKEKLMPGMYSVMDVMGREVMRGMNAAMDASSRAIFKTLYDDYQRYGKWNQT